MKFYSKVGLSNLQLKPNTRFSWRLCSSWPCGVLVLLQFVTLYGALVLCNSWARRRIFPLLFAFILFDISKKHTIVLWWKFCWLKINRKRKFEGIRNEKIDQLSPKHFSIMSVQSFPLKLINCRRDHFLLIFLFFWIILLFYIFFFFLSFSPPSFLWLWRPTKREGW